MLQPCFPAISSLLSAILVIGAGPASTATTAPPAPVPTRPSGEIEALGLVGFSEAETLYVQGKLLEAISVYQRLFLQTGEPVCLANIGRLYEERAEYELAAEHYRRFLLHPRVADRQKAQVRDRLLAIAPDDPLPNVLPPTPPSPGAPAGPAVPPPVEVDRSPRMLKGTGGVLMAVGIPGMVVGGVLAGQLRGLHDDLRRGDFDTADARTAAQDEASRKQGAVVGLLVCGALAVAAGVAVVIVGSRRAARVERTRRLAVHGPGLTLRF